MDAFEKQGAAGAVGAAGVTDQAGHENRPRTPRGRSDTSPVSTGDGLGGGGSSVGGGSRGSGSGQRVTEPKPIEIPPKLYRIGEVVEHSGVSRQTVHNYTTMGLLIEIRRTEGGHRLYGESVFERLNGIMALKARHKSLAYIREYFSKHAKLDAG